MSTIITTKELDALKTKLKTTWMAGDYDRFSRYMEQGARVFYEQLDVPAGCLLLDVACGSGQASFMCCARRSQRNRRRPRAQSGRAGTMRAPARKGSMHASWKAMPKTSRLETATSTLSPAWWVPCLPPGRNSSPASCCVCVVPEARSPWAIGRAKGSLDKCSRPSRGSSLLPACRLRCCGAMRP